MIVIVLRRTKLKLNLDKAEGNLAIRLLAVILKAAPCPKSRNIQ